MKHALAAATLFLVLFTCNASSADECLPDQSIRVGGLQYETGAFSTALVTEFIERGFGCKVVVRKGETLPLIVQLVSGDIDLIPEVWADDAPPIWSDALVKGKVVLLTTGALAASEGWYVPKFAASEGGIREIDDLRKAPKLFSINPSDNLGRFINCPLGSHCQIVNSKKLRAYRLTNQFVDFIPESYEAVEALALKAIDQHKPILFYFWEPSSLISTGQFQRVQEPSFDRLTWQSFSEATDPLRACETPTTSVGISANTTFVSEHKRIAEMISRISLEAPLLSSLTQDMRTRKWTATQAAIEFLHNHAGLWQQWVDATTAARIDVSLNN